jgi:hypothetical protein
MHIHNDRHTESSSHAGRQGDMHAMKTKNVHQAQGQKGVQADMKMFMPTKCRQTTVLNEKTGV